MHRILGRGRASGRGAGPRVTGTPNVLLQVTDEVTTRRYAVRIDPGESGLPASALLERYLKCPDLPRLRSENRITAASEETLLSLQDLVYGCTDEGALTVPASGVQLLQAGRLLGMEDVPRAEPVWVSGSPILAIDIAIDRTNVSYDRNWTGFNHRRWNIHPCLYSDFVEDCVERRTGTARTGAGASEMDLLEAVARRIWEADFESYSRFVGPKWVYKTGDETVRNIIGGGGGICSEKVQALKFITDHYGMESEYVIAGADVPDPAPESKLRELLTTFDFRFAKRQMRYWQHTALLYHVDGNPVLVDATNGNIPFLFVRGADAERLLGYDDKPPVRVSMAVHEEDFYYHRVAQDIPEMLFFAMEGWIPYVDLVQVFDNELGLYISKDFMVTAIVYETEKAYEELRGEYARVCGAAGLECAVSRNWTLDTPPGQRFAETEPAAAEKVLASRDHLLRRYDDCHGAAHDSGLVVISLRK